MSIVMDIILLHLVVFGLERPIFFHFMAFVYFNHTLLQSVSVAGDSKVITRERATNT